MKLEEAVKRIRLPNEEEMNWAQDEAKKLENQREQNFFSREPELLTPAEYARRDWQKSFEEARPRIERKVSDAVAERDAQRDEEILRALERSLENTLAKIQTDREARFKRESIIHMIAVPAVILLFAFIFAVGLS